ncbi:unnamed protein product, partial [Mesorhabditis spiculigera]
MGSATHPEAGDLDWQDTLFHTGIPSAHPRPSLAIYTNDTRDITEGRCNASCRIERALRCRQSGYMELYGKQGERNRDQLLRRFFQASHLDNGRVVYKHLTLFEGSQFLLNGCSVFRDYSSPDLAATCLIAEMGVVKDEEERPWHNLTFMGICLVVVHSVDEADQPDPLDDPTVMVPLNDLIWGKCIPRSYLVCPISEQSDPNKLLWVWA